ncbi:MAG: PKD domain-containing protein [Candidatus Bipolaricaulaceae bacterium]
MVRKIGLWALVVLATTVPLFAQGYFTVEQDSIRATVQPLAGEQPAIDFYGYDSAQFRSTCPLAELGATVMFLYREPAGQLYLFIIHDRGEPGAGGSAEFTIQGVPLGADFVLQDDAADMDFNDVYDIAGAQLRWVWGGPRTDGGVLGPLGTEFQITLTPGAITGIQRMVFLSGNVSSPQRTELGLDRPIVITGTRNQPPTARLTVTPGEPRARQEVVFDASGSSDPDGSIVEYRWDFNGDGAVDLVSTEPKVRFTYSSGGSFDVRLVLVDNAGAETSFTYSLYISPITVTATRSISTTTALPGSTFRVTVRIHTDQDLVGAGLQEDLPAGWELTPVENAEAVFKRPTLQWVFLSTIRAGSDRVITYDVQVPRSELLAPIRLPQQFCVTGVFQAKVPDVVIEVGGESCLIVDDCLSVEEAVAHLIPPSQPGDQDRIDLRLSEAISGAQLTRAGELWRTERPVVGTCGERVDLETLKLLTAYAKTCVPIDQPLPEMPMAQVSARRTILAPIPCEGVVLGFYDTTGDPVGNKFTVKVEISADKDVIGVGLDEDLPVGWRVTPLEHRGFIYKPNGNQWAMMDTLPARKTEVIIYEVEVPATTTIEPPPPDGCRVLASEAIVGRADTGLPCVEVDVSGQNRVDLTDCLSAIVAISRWDVARDRIDISLSDKITFQQVQRAIAFWLEDDKVPRTCGEGVITYETMKEIVARWLTDTPICEPLPGAAPDVCEGR